MADMETAAISAIIGAIVSYVGAVLQNMLAVRTKVDEALLKTREDLYKPVWDRMRLLPKWPRRNKVTYEQLTAFSESLRDWYFDGGGMYLSGGAQKKYANLQDTIAAVLRRQMSGDVSDKDYDDIRDRCSALRTEMTKDLLSRRHAPRV